MRIRAVETPNPAIETGVGVNLACNIVRFFLKREYSLRHRIFETNCVRIILLSRVAVIIVPFLIGFEVVITAFPSLEIAVKITLLTACGFAKSLIVIFKFLSL